MPFHTNRLTILPLAALAMAGLLPIVPGTAAMAALPQGAKAPDFTTQAVIAGKPFPFHLGDALKRARSCSISSRRLHQRLHHRGT
jgi:hypothetical protein